MKISLLYLLFCANHFDYLSAHQRIKTGPIIGKVTTNTARILVEFEHSGYVTMKLSSKDNNKKHLIVENALGLTPMIFKFDNLEPNTRYNISLSNSNQDNLGEIRASFKTLPENFENNSSLKIAIVACNDIHYTKKIPEKFNLWTDMAQKAEQGELDYVFHIGDQLYLDSDDWWGKQTSAHAVAKILYGVNYIRYKEQIREIIRHEYRKAFNFKPTKILLANTPNLMILDDHEIHNDFSRDKKYRTEGTWEHFWSNQARYVYYQYQRQLREDIDFRNFEETSGEFFLENIFDNKIGFFFMDHRANRVWHKKNLESDDDDEDDDSESYLDKKQKDYFYNSLKTKFKDTQVLFIISTIPIFMVSEETTKILAKTISEDFAELWTYEHSEDLVKFFDKLRKWKSLKKNREVILIGGDMHFAFHSDILYKNKTFFKQMTTSGIVMNKYDFNATEFIDSVMSIKHCIENKYCIKHHNWDTNYNYAIIEINNKNKTEVKSYHMLSNGSAIYKGKEINMN
jgi:phosphodiesterase/alkaline phosphatase D-like protein